MRLAIRASSKQLPETDAMDADCLVHAANTYATLRGRRFHKSMVSFGQAWAGYGATLTDGEFRRQARQLRPIVTWRSQILHVRSVPRGARVGYGATWSARRRSRIGLIPAGYADGYPMGLGSSDEEPRPACVGVEVGRGAGGEPSWRFVRVVGQVNMDQITVDLTDLPSSAGVGPGTLVELIGTDPSAPNHVPTLAAAAGTVPHELLCSLNPRIKRIYHAQQPYDQTVRAAAHA